MYWNSAYLDIETGEMVYHFIDDTQPSPKKEVTKITTSVPKKVLDKPKKEVTTSERAIFGRMKKMLSTMPRSIEGLSPIRKSYKELYNEDLKLSRANKDRLLSKYNNIYENLVVIKKKV